MDKEIKIVYDDWNYEIGHPFKKTITIKEAKQKLSAKSVKNTKT